MKVARELAKQAKKISICNEWHSKLKGLQSKDAMIEMYLKGIDFCLANDYPNNEYIRANFKGEMEKYGVFLDDEVELYNMHKCVALGSTRGHIVVDGFSTCEIFAKNETAISIVVKDNAFVVIDVFDNAVVMVHSHDNSKVCINKYGNSVVHTSDINGGAIKVIEKHKKTY